MREAWAIQAMEVAQTQMRELSYTTQSIPTQRWPRAHQEAEAQPFLNCRFQTTPHWHVETMDDSRSRKVSMSSTTSVTTKPNSPTLLHRSEIPCRVAQQALPQSQHETVLQALVAALNIDTLRS